MIIYLLCSGLVKDYVEINRKFTIQWADGEKSEQELGWMFGPLTKRHSLIVRDYVLAIYDVSNLNYLPGMVMDVNDNSVVIKFCDGTV